MDNNPYAASNTLPTPEVSAPPGRCPTKCVYGGLVTIYTIAWGAISGWIGLHVLAVLCTWFNLPGLLTLQHGEGLFHLLFFLLSIVGGMVLGWSTRRSSTWHRICIWGGSMAVPLFACGYAYKVYLVQPFLGIEHVLLFDLITVDLLVWTIAGGVVMLSGMLGWAIRSTHRVLRVPPLP
ncbi:hypothetical protein Pan181_33720 [Aeoliella mucimassa]|uniref:Uncharacterized protein n=1 Tax=Aeoliella mucimassa TaxID=2527972 RepID=A0A518AR12_9BACT|nr:hypothetical protein Pan181_33720 [Aeoliella mucimassa]